jgi:hypothetical protein
MTAITDQLAQALRDAREALNLVEREMETTYPATVNAAIDTIDAALAALAAYDAAPPAEPLQWHEAPLRTEWGDGMMAADVELSKDETLTLYAHADALALVPAALAGAAPPHQEGAQP